ncbi:hypothetical protein JG688_00009831 [Phytophthora aleatoria]|uniref:Uncharacterized protein n=1 Tax=Phytophthora aleatoria TaxID=2496075 RepID=A0A8J5M250_9STRA|nr:hypothetical protein JG688_00009831 [Phytophthora aleatoria]
MCCDINSIAADAAVFSADKGTNAISQRQVRLCVLMASASATKRYTAPLRTGSATCDLDPFVRVTQLQDRPQPVDTLRTDIPMG